MAGPDRALFTGNPWQYGVPVRRLPVVLLVLALAVVASVLWSLTRSGDSFAHGTRVFRGSGIEFSYPAGWNVSDQGWASTGLGSTFAILGTQPWGLCLPIDLNCHYQVRLESSQIGVSVSLATMAGENICTVAVDRSDLAGRGPSDPSAEGRLMRVGGRPTLQTDYLVNQADYYHSDQWRKWVIAAPGSTVHYYEISAMYRGPGVAEFRQQLDDLIGSVRFVGPARQPEPGPHDCSAPFP